MALGLLGLFFISILFIAITTMIITLFSKHPKVMRVGFIVTLVLTGLIMFLTVTSLPTNFITSQFVGLLPGIPALVSILMYFQNREGVSRAARIIACIGLASSLGCFIWL